MKEVENKSEGKIEFCPNCGGKLISDNRLAQGVWMCKDCDVRCFILITSKGKKGFK